MKMMDSKIFFTMLFGSEKLEPYVGRLKMASMIEIAEDNPNISPKVGIMQNILFITQNIFFGSVL